MSRENFERFRHLVLEDPPLQRELRDIPDQQLFVTRLVSFARARGIDVEAADVEAALLESRREWLERWI
jgi:hypothetical protein